MKYITIIICIFLASSCSILSELSIPNVSEDVSSSNSQQNSSRNYYEEGYLIPKEWFNTRDKKVIVSSWAYQKLLFKAIDSRNTSQIKDLLEKGANPNAGNDDYNEQSALSYAVEKGCYECIDLLMSKADVNFSYRSARYLPLVSAGLHSLKMVKFLTEKYSADPNGWSNGSWGTGKQFVINTLAKSESYKALIYLLDNGANPNVGQYSAWGTYISKGNMSHVTKEIVNAFIRNGAQIDINANNTNLLGETIRKKRFDITKLLLESGANPNYCVSGKTAYTPLYYAIEKNHFETVKMLVDHGANINAAHYRDCAVETFETPLSLALDSNTDQKIVDYLISAGAK